MYLRLSKKVDHNIDFFFQKSLTMVYKVEDLMYKGWNTKIMSKIKSKT